MTTATEHCYIVTDDQILSGKLIIGISEGILLVPHAVEMLHRLKSQESKHVYGSA